MESRDVLIEAFGRIREVVHHTVEGASKATLSYRPDENSNTVAWLIWHLARVQDDHVADAVGSEQVWTAAGWHDKFGLPFGPGATGYGQSADEVAAVDPSTDLLLDYYDAVHDRTLEFISALDDAALDRVVDDNWDPPVTLGVRLISVLSDDLQHAGQAAFARGAAERAGA